MGISERREAVYPCPVGICVTVITYILPSMCLLGHKGPNLIFSLWFWKNPLYQILSRLFLKLFFPYSPKPPDPRVRTLPSHFAHHHLLFTISHVCVANMFPLLLEVHPPSCLQLSAMQMPLKIRSAGLSCLLTFSPEGPLACLAHLSWWLSSIGYSLCPKPHTHSHVISFSLCNSVSGFAQAADFKVLVHSSLFASSIHFPQPTNSSFIVLEIFGTYEVP